MEESYVENMKERMNMPPNAVSYPEFHSFRRLARSIFYRNRGRFCIEAIL